MAEIDASIPLRAAQAYQPVNPLQNFAQATELATAQQNLLAQRAQQAAGEAFQASIRPDGTLDTNRLNQNLAGNPLAARAAIGASQAGQSNVQTALANMGMTQDQAFQRATYVGNALGSLLAQNKPVQLKDVQNIVGEVVANHGMTAKEGAQLIANAAAVPPDQLTDMAKHYYAMSQHSAQMLAPQPTAIDNGQTIGLVNTNPMASTPVGTPMAGFEKTLSPGENAQQVPVMGANNTPGIMSLQDVLRAQRAQSQAAGQPVVSTGLPAGQQAAIETTAKSSADMGQQLIADAQQLPQQRASLQQVASEIDSANPGPLNDKLTKIGGVLTQLGVSSDQATASQLMHKATMLNVISTASSSLGVPTDSKMAAAMSATPNDQMTPQAAKTATGMLMGLVDYKQAKAEAWQKYQAQNGPQSFNQFQTEWNKNVPNAAAFQLSYLPKPEQSKYLKSLSSDQQKQLVGAINFLPELQDKIRAMKNGS